MHKQKTSIILFIVVSILVISVALWFIPIATTVDLSLHGYVITSDGEILETVEIDVYGPMNRYLFKEDQFALHISTNSESWNFATPSSMASAHDPYIDIPYMSFFTHIISLPAERSGGGNFALSLEDGYFIAGYYNDNTRFLVGSTSANTNPTTILEYFSDYIDFYFSPS